MNLLKCVSEAPRVVKSFSQVAWPLSCGPHTYSCPQPPGATYHRALKPYLLPAELRSPRWLSWNAGTVHSGCCDKIPQTRWPGNDRIDFSWSWRLGSPGSRLRQVQCLVRACFPDFPLQPHMGEKARELPGPFGKGTNLIYEGPTLRS